MGVPQEERLVRHPLVGLAAAVDTAATVPIDPSVNQSQWGASCGTLIAVDGKPGTPANLWTLAAALANDRAWAGPGLPGRPRVLDGRA